MYLDFMASCNPKDARRRRRRGMWDGAAPTAIPHEAFRRYPFGWWDISNPYSLLPWGGVISTEGV